ncbi:hypothetical protein [Chitinophaga sp.]|uniref:hypothetical protein n=1 Tax=Chitinophaga sp. TaxID=1869181 RepID=UPI0031DF4FC1
MLNWLTLSDTALLRAADYIDRAETALQANDTLGYERHKLSAMRYQHLSRYCMLRMRRMFGM